MLYSHLSNCTNLSIEELGCRKLREQQRQGKGARKGPTRMHFNPYTRNSSTPLQIKSNQINPARHDTTCLLITSVTSVATPTSLSGATCRMMYVQQLSWYWCNSSRHTQRRKQERTHKYIDTKFVHPIPNAHNKHTSSPDLLVSNSMRCVVRQPKQASQVS